MRDSTGKFISSWTTDEIKQAIKLWAAGKSAAQIANDLGRGRTRNSVIGRLHRLGLKVEDGWRIIPRALIEGLADSPASPPVLAPAPKPEPLAIEPLAPSAAEPGVTFRDLRECHCRYIAGAVDGLNTIYCGSIRAHPSHYCEMHRAIMYGPGARGERRAWLDFTAKSVLTGGYQ